MRLHGILRRVTVALISSAFTKNNTGLGAPRFACIQPPIQMSLKTDHIQLVDYESASLNGKRTMYLRTDHSGLNKYHGSNDEKFLLVQPEIYRMVQGAPKPVEGRCHCMSPLFCARFMSFAALLISLQHPGWSPERTLFACISVSGGFLCYVGRA